jgi:hypothetical protein
MAGEIVVPDDLPTNELLPVPVQDKVAIQEMTAPSYLPRLELFTASKNLVKAGKFAVNNWGIVKAKDRVVDIGKKIHAYPVSWRFKAMNFTDLKKVGSNFDNKSAEFKAWKLEAEKKLPQGVLSKYMAGIEFLMCINGFDGLVTYMCASVSQKNNVAELIAFLEARKFVEMDSYWKVTPDFQFQCPTVKLFEGEFDLPPIADINRVTYKFLNTKVEEHEKDLEGGDEVKVDVAPERAH